eukprot:346818-Amphidinium_carterae.1
MSNTLCQNANHHLWSAWLDVFFMWSVDTPLPQIYAEYGAVKYDHIRRWVTTFQQAAAKTARIKINFNGLHRSLRGRPLRFRPTVLKKPSAAVKRKPVSNYHKKLIVEVDE